MPVTITDSLKSIMIVTRWPIPTFVAMLFVPAEYGAIVAPVVAILASATWLSVAANNEMITGPVGTAVPIIGSIGWEAGLMFPAASIAVAMKLCGPPAKVRS